MEKFKVLGIQTNSGVIKATGKEWTNYTLHCSVTDDKRIVKGLVGSWVDSVKIPQKVMEQFVENYGSKLLGLTVLINFRRVNYGGIDKIVVADFMPVDEE